MDGNTGSGLRKADAAQDPEERIAQWHYRCPDSHSALDDRDAHGGGVGEEVEHGAVLVDDLVQLLVALV